MKFCQNIIKTQFNSKIFVIIFCLLSHWSQLTLSIPFNANNLSDFDYNLSALGEECDPNSDNIKQCPAPSTYCHKQTKICECVTNYPIPIPEAGDCLDYRRLGQTCLIDFQCQQIEFTHCVGNTHQINGTTIENFHRMNYMKRGRYGGRCQCKKGYKQIGEKCYPNSYDPLNCSHTHHCLLEDPKSRCDLISGQCYCYSKYIYDKNLCRLKTYGDICKIDSECQHWDQNLECNGCQCNCKRSYVLDSLYFSQKDIFSAHNIIVCKEGNNRSDTKTEELSPLQLIFVKCFAFILICIGLCGWYMILVENGCVNSESMTKFTDRLWKYWSRAENQINPTDVSVAPPLPDLLLPNYELANRLNNLLTFTEK